MRRIIIDTDGNFEALAAIGVALRDKSVCVQAITTVAARLSAQEAALNVRAALAAQAAEHVKIYRGLERPLVSRNTPLKQDRHKLLESVDRTAALHPKSAVDALIELSQTGEIEIIAAGPMTNIALAITKNKAAMSRLSKITMLAGMIFHGDVGPLSEYNCFTDPYAADCVLKSGLNITIVPIDVGNLSERMKLALHPELVKVQYDSYTRIEVDGELTFGACVNDVRNRNRQEFVAQSNVMHPFNCKLVADNTAETITMEA